MKKLLLFLAFSLLLSPFSLLWAQRNFVPNPSFEADIHAPDIQKFNWNKYLDWRTDSLNDRKENELILTTDWWQPTNGTPDYLNSKRSWLLGWKTKTARTGLGRMAIIGGLAKNSFVTWLFYQDTYSEYIECRLNDTLVAGKMYRVQYYVALDEKSNYACDHWGAAVTRDCVLVKAYHSTFYGDDPVQNVEMQGDHFVTSDEGWVLVCDTFIARGGERYLTLGTFMGNFPRHVHKVKKSQHGSLRVAPFNKYSYYYIDDVSLTEVHEGEDICEPPKDSVIRDNLVFLIDASGSMSEKGLLDDAKDAIESLCAELPAGDHVTIISYSDQATVLAQQLRADNKEGIHEALKDLKSSGGTNIVAGFNAAYASIRVNMLATGNNKIVVLTDGRIYLPEGEKNKILTAAAKEGIKVSVVFFGDHVPEDVKKFAVSTGGDAHAVLKGHANDALKEEVPPTVVDTPYGKRSVGRIIGWEALTKLIFPVIVAGALLKALKLI